MYNNSGPSPTEPTDAYTYQTPPPPPPTRTPAPYYTPSPSPTAAGCTAAVPYVQNGAYLPGYGGTSATLQCNLGNTPSAYGQVISCSGNVWQGQIGSCTAAVAPGGGTGFAVAPGGRSQPHGRFVAVNTALHWDEARAYCERTFPGGTLASIHSKEEQKDADDACREMPLSTDWGDSNQGHPHACWIGMYEDHARNGFVWADDSPGPSPSLPSLCVCVCVCVCV